MIDSAPHASNTPDLILQWLRGVCHLATVIIITVWAFTAWPLPLAGIFMGFGALVLTVLIWALFLSPRPVLRTDKFGQSLIELLLIAGAVAAMLAMGVNWVVAALFGVVAAVLGLVASMRTN